MDVLLKKCTIIDPSGPHHRKEVDVLIHNGVIEKIGKRLTAPNAKCKLVEANNLHLSPGWLDIMPWHGEPGFEQVETLTSLCAAAAAGGYTAVAPAPNTQPVADQFNNVRALGHFQNSYGVRIHPLGALSVGTECKDLTEIYDLTQAGAVAFTDGWKSVQHSGLLLRALEYVRPLKRTVINQPHERNLENEGLMHEGVTSTLLGMKGIPALAEEIMVHRDLELARYAGSAIHILSITSKGSVRLVKEGKKQGIPVSASVAIMNLLAIDEDVRDFDPAYKIWPPLRSAEDQKALLAGVKNQTIDVITSNHSPSDQEHKDLEFAYAAYGITQLQTCFPAFNSAFPEELDTFVLAVSQNPRSILGLKKVTIEVGEPVEMTLFNPTETWTFTRSKNRSQAINTPFFDHPFTGKVVGTIIGDQLNII